MRYTDMDASNSSLSFPLKLYDILEKEDNEIVHWAPHGFCFKIEDPDRFAYEIVPRYFKQTKLASFQRQLNLYGFRRLAKGEDQGCYYHPKFQRERKDFVAEIKRLPARGAMPTIEEVRSGASPSGSSHKRKYDDYERYVYHYDSPYTSLTSSEVSSPKSKRQMVTRGMRSKRGGGYANAWDAIHSTSSVSSDHSDNYNHVASSQYTVNNKNVIYPRAANGLAVSPIPEDFVPTFDQTVQAIASADNFAEAWDTYFLHNPRNPMLDCYFSRVSTDSNDSQPNYPAVNCEASLTHSISFSEDDLEILDLLRPLDEEDAAVWKDVDASADGVPVVDDNMLFAL